MKKISKTEIKEKFFLFKKNINESLKNFWNDKENTKIKSFTKFFLIIYGIILLVYCSIYGPFIIGEWDDYSLPTVSIMKQLNFSIDEQDLKNFKQIFPEWSNFINSYELSGYTDKNGGEMSWYFPIYSLACIPYIYILNFLDISATYTFTLTNLSLLMLMLFIVYKFLNIDNKKKLLLILCLSINPIIFYLSWISAEVCIYSLIGIALVFWYNKWYKRAGFTISLSGMLNPTILSIGIIMIIEYLFTIFKNKPKEQTIKEFIQNNFKNVIAYGSSYLIALVPFVYNYYHTGHINLTASLSGFTHGEETTIMRFLSYLFDLNFGIFPYFSILFLIAFALIPAAIYKKQWKYIIWMSCFFINVFLYSIMVHINSGMSGIARYNAWGAVILLFAVCLYYDKIIEDIVLKRLTTVLLIIGIILTSSIILDYGMPHAKNTSYVYFTPIAERVLNNRPELYNPLPSTFNSRVKHFDGGYEYSTPIVHFNPKGYVKKILATAKDADEILNNYTIIYGNKDWLKEQVEKLTDKETYISVPKNYIIIRTRNSEKIVVISNCRLLT